MERIKINWDMYKQFNNIYYEWYYDGVGSWNYSYDNFNWWYIVLKYCGDAILYKDDAQPHHLPRMGKEKGDLFLIHTELGWVKPLCNHNCEKAEYMELYTIEEAIHIANLIAYKENCEEVENSYKERCKTSCIYPIPIGYRMLL